MLAVVLAGGWWSFRMYAEELRANINERFETITQLKVNQLVQWRKDRLADAGVLMDSGSFIGVLAKWMKAPDAAESKEILFRFRSVAKYNDYRDVLLVDADGQPRLSLSGRLDPLCEEEKQAMAKALHDQSPEMTDLHVDIGDTSPTLDVIAPIFTKDGDAIKPIGAVFLEVDAGQFLYPVIQSWPTPSQTAEILLVRRDGDNVLFLNELRYKKDTALKLRVPLSQVQILAVKAVLGQRGLVEGRDYRGGNEVGEIRAVPDSPWVLVAKEDAEEYLEPLRQSLWVSASIVGLLILAMAQAFIFVERQQAAAQALRESEELKRLMIESAKDYAIIMLDPVGRVRNWNPGAERIIGYRAEEIIGQHFSCFYPEEKIRDRFPEFELRVAAEKGRFEDEGWRVRKDGSLYWADVVISAMHNAQGKLLGFVKLTRDVTARKEATERIQNLNEELQRRADLLETANKELEAFSYSVSHDLRAPLRAVDGFSQAVLEDYRSHLPPEGQHYLQTIREGAQRMGTLIDDLLTFSRLSRTPLNKQSVNTSKLVRNVLEDLNSEREGRQVEIKIGELPSCQGDPALLKQVWVNLLSNSLKYTRTRKPAVIEIGCKSEQNETVYFVRDNGVGFDMRYAGKLFGVFQRLHRSEEFEGTGVGLAIVQRVIHRHGGRIWAEAEPDRGATFFFTLKGKNK